jgi:hypothetical protein
MYNIQKACKNMQPNLAPGRDLFVAGVGMGTFCNCKMRRFEYGPSWGRMEGLVCPREGKILEKWPVQNIPQSG